MKVCKICKEEKDLSEFHPNKQCSLGVVGTCRSCSRDRIRGWYNKTREERNKASTTFRQERKLFWIERMGGKCQDCGGVFPPCVYDFHHLEGKDANPSKALTWRPDRMEEEMKKCTLLCANCHRVRHHGDLE